jgi:hypothetical protein
MMIFENHAADGTFNNAASNYSATGPVLVRFSGTLTRKVVGGAKLVMYSRSDTADFEIALSLGEIGAHQVNLASGDEYYFVLSGVDAADSLDLSVVSV